MHHKKNKNICIIKNKKYMHQKKYASIKNKIYASKNKIYASKNIF